MSSPLAKGSRVRALPSITDDAVPPELVDREGVVLGVSKSTGAVRVRFDGEADWWATSAVALEVTGVAALEGSGRDLDEGSRLALTIERARAGFVRLLIKQSATTQGELPTEKQLELTVGNGPGKLGLTLRGNKSRTYVVSVDSGSAGAQAGVLAGDVLLAVNGEAATSLQVVKKLVQAARANDGQQMTLQVERKVEPTASDVWARDVILGLKHQDFDRFVKGVKESAGKAATSQLYTGQIELAAPDNSDPLGYYQLSSSISGKWLLDAGAAAGDTAAVVARMLGLDEFAVYVEQYGGSTDTKSATTEEASREAKKTKGKQSDSWTNDVISGIQESNFDRFKRGVTGSGGWVATAKVYDSDKPEELVDPFGYYKLRGTGSGSYLTGTLKIKAGATALDIARKAKRTKMAEYLEPFCEEARKEPADAAMATAIAAGEKAIGSDGLVAMVAALAALKKAMIGLPKDASPARRSHLRP